MGTGICSPIQLKKKTRKRKIISQNFSILFGNLRPILDMLRSIKIQERLALNGEPHLKPAKIEAQEFGEKVIGVTSILQKTMSENQREVLRRWRERMILEMGESGFKIYQKNLLEYGTDTHYLIECFAKENEAAFEKSFEKASQDVKGFWKSVEPILRSGDVIIKESEYRIRNSQLPYTGIADSIGRVLIQAVYIRKIRIFCCSVSLN